MLEKGHIEIANETFEDCNKTIKNNLHVHQMRIKNSFY